MSHQQSRTIKINEQLRQLISFTLLLCVLSSWFVSYSAFASNTIKSVRVWPSPDSARIVFDLKQKPNYTYFTLHNPYRLVIDLQDTNDEFDWSRIKTDSKLVKRIRQSTPKSKKDVRIVLELQRKLSHSIFPLGPAGPYGHRLVVDIIDPDLRNTKRTSEPKGERKIVIGIDAGHGGEDPGSIGPRGTYEKNVVMKLSKRLATLINQDPTMKVVMIRSSDYYIHVNRRTDIARKNKVDFLMSIHADAFTTPQPSGASVWVLSLGRAESEIGKWMEQSQKYSELLGGAAQVIGNSSNDAYLARTLLDMSMDHSMDSGYDAAKEIIAELRLITKMHKTRPQAASLAVLRSPDIPSILVEVGFISNPQEEKKLLSSAHQKKLANALYKGLKNYFNLSPPEGTLLAKQAKQKAQLYRVKRGDSLSVIAMRFGISVRKLKQANKLKSNVLQIGQVLTIPKV